MRIAQKLLSAGKRARSGIKFSKPLESIVVHWIGPYPNHAVSTPWNWWENGSDGKGVQASAHFIVKDADMIQYLPLEHWHRGGADEHRRRVQPPDNRDAAKAGAAYPKRNRQGLEALEGNVLKK